MDDILKQVSSLIIPMWQRRWIGLLVAWLVTIAGMGVVYVMRDKYEASARVFVDTQTVLKPLMNGLAFQPDVDQQVRMLARTLISRPNIERLISSPRIGMDNLSPSDKEKFIDRLSRDIKVAPSGDANLFAISYRDINPDRARRIVEELVSLFVTAGIVDKQRDSEQARQFLDEQIRTYEAKLSAAENRLKEFKLKNFGLTGATNQDYFASVSSASNDINRLKVDLHAAEQARDALKHELSNEDPNLPLEATNTPQAPTETEARLDALKRQLDDMSRRYTDEHPDVLALKRNIAALETLKRQEADARAKLGKGKTAPTSPVFQKIRVELADAEAKVASLRGQISAQQAQLDQAKNMASRMPEVEAELAQLNRDYDVVRKNYEQLVARRESASLGEEIDRTTKVAEFRVVEPPRVSSAPSKPSRQMVALLTVVAALGAGVAATFGLSQLFPTVNDISKLKEVSGRPVLGSVTLVVSPDRQVKVRRDLQLFSVTLLVLLTANGALFVAVMRQMLP